MTAFKARLSQLEARLQSLIEGGAARLFASGHLLPHDLSHRLVEAMQAGARPGPGGELQAPNLFILMVHPSQADAYLGDQALLDELGRDLRQAGLEEGFIFPGPVAIRVDAAPELAVGEVQVFAYTSLDDVPHTTDIETSFGEKHDWTPRNAFLIVDGTQVYPLVQSVLNIGRRSDNHLVIDDARVSRLHAQLRFVKGRYVIFDLDSRGGTWVNGVRIRQQALYPGDVISLSGVPLVFGQDDAGQGETQEYSPLSGNR